MQTIGSSACGALRRSAIDFAESRLLDDTIRGAVLQGSTSAICLIFGAAETVSGACDCRAANTLGWCGPTILSPPAKGSAVTGRIAAFTPPKAPGRYSRRL